MNDLNETWVVQSSSLPPEDEKEYHDGSSVIAIPVDKMDLYEGAVTSDIFGANGAVILPAGVDLSMMGSSMPNIKQRLKSMGIEKICIRLRPQFSEQDIEEAFDRVYSGKNELIPKEQVRKTIKQVGGLFDSVRRQKFEPEMITPIADMGIGLAEEIMRNPSVALSLCKVHDVDEYTFVHSFNVAVMTGYLANHLYPGNRDFIHKIVVGALLHDIGKAKIPLEILNKPGPLDKNELAEMHKHPRLGVEMSQLSGIENKIILDVIGSHHEKWSGDGYPLGLKMQSISEAARITAVADVFDALTSKRSYKNPMTSRDALMLIIKDAGGHFDTKIARELLISLGLYPPGSFVRLSNGNVGLVVSGGGKDLIRPLLMLKGSNAQKQDDEQPVFIDLKKTKELHITSYLGHAGKRDLE